MNWIQYNNTQYNETDDENRYYNEIDIIDYYIIYYILYYYIVLDYHYIIYTIILYYLIL